MPLEDTDLVQIIERMAGSSDAPLSAFDRLAELRMYVTRQISRMLETDRGLLFSILYRIDVPENDVLQCLSSTADESVAERLAELVVQRQLMKIELRRRWSGKTADNADTETDDRRAT